MPTSLPVATPTSVTVPTGATYEVTRTPDGAPIVTLYTATDEPAVQLCAEDHDAVAALAQSAHALATAMGVMVS